MKILIALTYYRPHYSGLTIYVERLATALVGLGHTVTILTSRYESSLPAHEFVDGVELYRLGVVARISKGVIMPTMLARAWREIRKSDIVNLHLPQLDAAPLAVSSRLLGKPVVLTYHCDLMLPKGFVHTLANRVSSLANHISAAAANGIVTNTLDYAEHSPFLNGYLGKVQVIQPPVVLPEISELWMQQVRKRAEIQPGERIIGMAARLATEKGVEYLVEAMPLILEKYPTARVLFVGQYEHVLGEEAYARRLAPLIERLGKHWMFLGVLLPEEFTAFLHLAEVTVLPSINSTESFGMVQVESMLCGTPVVATNLPGVRQPVRTSGMGRIVPAQDGKLLAEAVISIFENPQMYVGDQIGIKKQHAAETVAEKYVDLFCTLIC